MKKNFFGKWTNLDVADCLDIIEALTEQPNDEARTALLAAYSVSGLKRIAALLNTLIPRSRNTLVNNILDEINARGSR